METKTILVAEATIQESPFPRIQIKDESGLTYTIPKTKRDGDPTQAYLTQQALGDLTGKWYEVGYNEKPAPQGGAYRTITVIQPAGEIKEPPKEDARNYAKVSSKVSSPPSSFATDVPIKTEPDWDEINWQT